MKDWRTLIRRNTWILLAAATLLLRWILGYFPAIAEQYYSRGLFLGIRFLQDYSTGLLPFPSIYVLLPLLLAWAGWRILRRRRQLRGPLKARLWNGLHRLASLASILLCLFFWLWGFNYSRLPIADALSLDLVEPDLPELQAEVEALGQMAAAARMAIPGVSPADSLSPAMLGEDLEGRARTAIRRSLSDLGYPAQGIVRARRIRPGTLLLRFNVAGIYNPFTGEGNVSNALTAAQIPFTMTHEMAHGHGFGNEGECNFLAGLACAGSQDPLLRYAGTFTLWRYLAYELRRRDPEAYQAQEALLSPGTLADLQAIRANARRYDGALSKVGEQVNDSYLKAQGVPGGIQSYGQVARLYLAWRQEGNSF